MKETGIIMSGSHPKLILEGKKTMTRRVVTKNNSVIGEGGDWANLDFNGQVVDKDTPIEWDLKWLEIERRAPLPFVDGKPETGQYLHVPYNWAEGMTIYRVYPKYEVGDRLWVRETWATEKRLDHLSPSELGNAADVALWYKADANQRSLLERGKWRPSIFMPRWASRITLEIVGIRVEKLQEISLSDIKAEGIVAYYDCDEANYRILFQQLWDSLNKKRGYGWEENPWVWCLQFKLV